MPRRAAREDSVSTGTEAVDYSKLRQDLARTVARICPSWLANERDDLVQAAVMRVMQIVSRKGLESEGGPPLAASYLYKVAYSALVDQIRRVRRRRETGIEDGTLELAASPEDPERTAASREIGLGIQGCLSRLKYERRLAVTLYLQGHTVPGASRILDWSTKRTENLVFRGLADLRECLLSRGLRP
jgi:RNA polymerase sigma-70 factor (ECF subfamily)